jgi:hypothetical protein
MDNVQSCDSYLTFRTQRGEPQISNIMRSLKFVDFLLCLFVNLLACPETRPKVRILRILEVHQLAPHVAVLV